MPEYSYEALTEAGAVTRGTISAASEDELGSMLRDEGRFLISAQLADEAQAASGANGGPPKADAPKRLTDGRIPRRELLALTDYLWGSTRAGIPLLTTLQDVELQLESKRLQQILVEIRESMVGEGKSLSEAMAEHPKAFPELYIGTIQAGETSGQLDFVLGQLVEYLEWQQEITLNVRQATLYPAIIILVMLGLVLLLILYVYPQLMPIFASYDVELPLPTRVVMGTGEFVGANWFWMILAAVGALVGWTLIGRTSSGRLAIDTIKLRLPIFGKLLHQLEMARIVTYMALFFRTGIDLLRGLELLEEIIKNSRVAKAVREARGAIIGGDSMAHALSATGLFPVIVVRSFAMGETTGKLDESLERARVYYAREVPSAVRRMLTALQPLLIIMVGGVIAIVALSIFLPVVQIYQALSP